MDLTALKLNKYQTPYTNEVLRTLPDIVIQWLEEAISNHLFIQRLISKDRPYAKDCERDKKGRAKLDLTNPYILTDISYFTQTADFYRKNGCYTFMKPNPNPNSEYRRFWRQEIYRCWDGMLRTEDGAYITGLEYFYLNFYRMLVAKITEGTKRAKRVFDFPAFYELAHYRYRYIEYALEAGLNAIELSKRGSGKSYSIASILAHNLILGIDSEQRNGTVGGFIASDKTYLDTKKDGTLKKFVDELAFLRRNTEFPRLMTSQSGNEMAWKKGYKDASGGESEESSIVFGTSVADDSDKLRGKRGWFMYEEMGNFPNLYETYAANLRGASEGDYSIGLIYLIGTANNKESNFESAKTLLYKPKEHSIFSLPNVYDEEKKGRDEFGLFTPAYLNRLGCYDKDGISDVTKALLQIMLARYKAYQSGEAFALLHAIAEDPIDPTEAMIQSRSAYFPVTQLNERLTWLTTHPEELNQHYIGTLAMNGDGEVVFKPTKDIPLRHWNRSKENKQNENLEGALEIFQMPQKSPRTCKIISDRYVIGCLKEGELVNTDKGLKKVEEVTLDDKLINIDGKFVDIKNLQTYQNDGLIYSIKLWSILKPTKFSKEHPIYCCTPKRKYRDKKEHLATGLPEQYKVFDRWEFVRAEDVKVGQYVKAPIPYLQERSIEHLWDESNIRIDFRIDNPLHNPDFWYLMGVIIGDGWASCNGNTITISLNSNDTFVIDRCRQIVNQIFNRTFSVTKENGQVKEYSFNNKSLNQFIGKYIGKGAENKHIDEQLKWMPFECRKNLILGMIDTDGCVYKGIDYVSISERLVSDMQDILYSLRIRNSVKMLRDESVHNIKGKLCKTKKTYQLHIALEGFNTIKSWGIPNMRFDRESYYSVSNHAVDRVRFEGDYLFIQIQKIETEEYEGKIYNYECDTHTFMCNYIPTHNCDPVDQENGESASLFCVIVFDRMTNRIVAEYTGRKQFSDENYEIVRLLCFFYDARCLYENNIHGMYNYFKQFNCTYLLYDCPEWLKQTDKVKYNGVGVTMKGVRRTNPVKAVQMKLIHDWLLSSEEMNVVDDDGEEKVVSQPMLYTIDSPALLEELIGYYDQANVDRISALGMVMLIRESYKEMGVDTVHDDTEREANEFYSSAFFDKMYEKRKIRGRYTSK